MIPLRNYQFQLDVEVRQAWLGGAANVLAVSATGSGKTVFFSHVVANEPGASCVIAHRHELVSQISLALARNGVRHRIIGADSLMHDCRAAHIEELGVSYVDPNSRVAAASVDTLIRMDPTDPWFASVALWVMDEAHHLLKNNKWGKAVAMFANARGLGVTAETERADGYGLGAQNDGVFHAMVEAPHMRQIINMGFLTDYRVFCPPSDLDLSEVPIGPSGEYVPLKLAKATKSSHITGDAVAHYLKICPGKLAIAFAVDIEAAEEMAAAFRAAGVKAEMISSKTKSSVRRDILRKFKRREILVLVNVDLFGEGFDLPAIEVVIMARATQSYNLFKQQFGRVLRLLDGKLWGIVIDHVGNVLRHGLPDKVRPGFPSLGKPVPKSKREADENIIPMTVCCSCSNPFERVYKACPACGWGVQPAARSAPEFVDGDLFELTQDVLAKMRGDADHVTNTGFIPVPYDVPPYVAASIRKKHVDRADAQQMLRGTIALWAGWQKQHHGRSDSEIMRLFYLTYGTDVLTAQTLGAAEAYQLRDKLQERLNSQGVVAAQS